MVYFNTRSCKCISQMPCNVSGSDYWNIFNYLVHDLFEILLSLFLLIKLIKNPSAITIVPIHTKLIMGNIMDLITIQSSLPSSPRWRSRRPGLTPTPTLLPGSMKRSSSSLSRKSCRREFGNHRTAKAATGPAATRNGCHRRWLTSPRRPRRRTRRRPLPVTNCCTGICR